MLIIVVLLIFSILIMIFRCECMIYNIKNWFIYNFQNKYKEHFSTNVKKLFVLQSEKTNYTITTLPDEIIIGFFENRSVDLFKKIYKLNNCHTCSNFIFKKLNKKSIIDYGNIIDWEEIQLILLEDEFISIMDTKPLIYYPISKFRDRIKVYFPNYEMVIYNDRGSSFIFLNPEPAFPKPTYNITQKVSYDYINNFVITGKINGKYFSKEREDVIILNQNKLDDYEVKVGDTIKIDVEKSLMNGIYYVYKVDKKIHMRKSTPFQFKTYTCIDDDLSEYPHFNNKYSCESKYNADGTKKKKKMIWDSRCLRHYECPFFNYDGEYGGECDNGYCKFPPGLKQISYKKYKKSDNICEQQIK